MSPKGKEAFGNHSLAGSDPQKLLVVGTASDLKQAGSQSPALVITSRRGMDPRAAILSAITSAPNSKSWQADTANPPAVYPRAALLSAITAKSLSNQNGTGSSPPRGRSALLSQIKAGRVGGPISKRGGLGNGDGAASGADDSPDEGIKVDFEVERQVRGHSI